MKNFHDDKATLEDLKYENIFKIIKEAENDSKDDSSELDEDDLKSIILLKQIFSQQ
jgi:hypothetical protein